jgi:hypothetical protein
MVAAQAHQKGSMKSASSPSSMKTIQNIFFCIGSILRYGKPEPIRCLYKSWMRIVYVSRPV